MRLLKERGIPVPRWTVIKPETKLSASEWGEVVVVKPAGYGVATFSRGVQLQMTADVRFKLPHAYPEKHPGRDGPMMAQQFIDTGLQPAQIRVLTLFGVPLYAEKISSVKEQPLPAARTKELVSQVRITPVSAERARAFVYDADVLDLARRVAAVFPSVPLQGIDILREAKTGKLFVLEINPGGNTWHFSSKYGRHQRVEGKKRQDQFDAFSIAADVLIERTRNEAR
jgi:glutathione synthase/RimK-type ligase-like ATP-grasp enzyme